ncbi:hypothetical protein L6452_14614 [Arctium lappa]|uniref:Uncharacterized protein n=1 Tax=Arctium lappa TaxID=4217 RepID=A0ACB9CLJ2_ARCLA|nr:hypothetical protein L6452_14614 [Arctium lappa]
MDDSSKSPHTYPGSSYPSSVGNNPLPPPQPPSPPQGATTSSSKRKKPSTDHEELQQDDADSTNTPMKCHPTNSSTARDHEDAAAMNTGGSPRKEEIINLLNDILDFYNKKGRYPDDSEDVDEFYKKWIERRTRVYRNEGDLKRKIKELHVKFVKNLERTYGGEDIKSFMDPVDVKIYQLSYRVWGKEDDIAFDHNDSKDENISKDSSKQEIEDSKDLKASSEKETDDENDSKVSSSNDSKDSKDSSSLNDSKDSSSLNDSSDSEYSSSNDSEDSSSLSDSEDTLSDSEDTSSLNDSKDSSSNDSSTEQETNNETVENDTKDSTGQ